MNDVELIEKTLSGDREAFGRLVHKYQSSTYALAFQRIGNGALAEEIAQDAFVTAYQKLGQLKDRRRFGNWLRSITIRLCGMWLRSQKRKPRTRPLPVGHVAESSADQSPEALFDIDALIQRLPERLRAAAVLCLQDEFSPSEAAAVLGLKPATLRKRLHDARAQLQRQIVEVAEKELEMHLLPGDFAERCICRCERAQEARVKGKVKNVARKKNCGCGCLGDSRARRPTKSKTKQKKGK
jgi:RNA polymerase sigma-70 factor (ECF subfamily)